MPTRAVILEQATVQRTYLVRTLGVALTPWGDTYDIIDGSVYQEVRSVRVEVRMRGVFEQTAGPALSIGRLLATAMAGTATTLYPDSTDLTVSLPVLPDLRDVTIYGREGRLLQREMDVRWLSAQSYAPDDPVILALIDLTPA